MSLDEQMSAIRNQSKRKYPPISPSLGTGTELMNQREEEGNVCLDKRIFGLLIPFGIITLINDPHVSDRVLNGIKGLFS